MSFNQEMIQRALTLAQRGIGAVSPNPMVGAVLAIDQHVVSEGYHRVFGGPHAEVDAIGNLADKSLLPKATLYVTLEPCCHHGKKTPPCSELIIRSGIKRVVVGVKDPNPMVAGNGIAQLRAAGIEVQEGVLAPECQEINRRFFTFIQKQRPYVIFKWAQTADGFIARPDGSSKWISSIEARTLTHQWRTEESAILVGTHTALIDNPELTSRLVEGKNPVRIVVDRNLKTPKTAKLFNSEAKTLVFNQVRDSAEDNIEYIKIDFNADTCRSILHELHARKILSVIIEGGSGTLKRFIDAGLWDEARWFSAPVQFGEGIAAPKLNGTPSRITSVGPDSLYEIRRD